MGHNNYIVISKLKMAIRVSSHLDEDHIENIEKFLNQCDNFNYDIPDKNYKDLTLKDLSELIGLANSAWVFDDMYRDIFLLFWLNHNEIKYENKHEDEIDKEIMKEKGYRFLE